MKTVHLKKKPIAASDLKVSGSIHLIEYMKVCEFKGHCHFLTLAQGRVQTKFQTGFSQKLLCRSEPNFV